MCLVNFFHFYKEKKLLWIPIFLNAHQKPFWKGVYSKRKEFSPLAPKRTQFCLFRVDSFFRREKNNFDRVASHEWVPISSWFSIVTATAGQLFVKHISKLLWNLWLFVGLTELFSSYFPYFPLTFGQLYPNHLSLNLSSSIFEWQTVTNSEWQTV